MSELLASLAMVFVLGGAFLLVGNWLELPTVPFFILAGIVAGFVIDEELTLELARYGIVLLVFTFSLQIQFETVRTVLSDSEVVALGQVLVLGVLGVVAGLSLGFPPAQALYLGIAAAFSSTIVGTSLLQPELRRNLVHGRIAQTVQFVQDLLAIFVILVLSADSFAADAIAAQLGYGVVLLAAGIVVNRQLFDRIGRLSRGSDELMLVGVIALLVAFLAAAELMGVSFVVGAFVAGIAVRRDPAEYLGMLNGLESIRDFFTAVFFVTLGALVAVPTAEVVLTAAVLVTLTAIAKPAVSIVLLQSKGYGARTATLTSLGLDQVSELSLIIAIEALIIGVLVQPVFDAIILAAAATMITSSLSHQYDTVIYRRLVQTGLLARHHEQVDEHSVVSDSISDHVVIVGYGRQGRRLAAVCGALDRPFVVIENDPSLLEVLESECDSYVFGHAMDRYVWDKARVDDARLVVSTVESERLSKRLLALADETGADVILRARTASTALELLERGALYVNVPDVLAAERLADLVEEVVTGDLSGAELRRRYMDDLVQQAGPRYRTVTDELKALR